MKKIFCLLLVWPWVQFFAQEYPIYAISDSLVKNADAVVRYYETDFVQSDMNNATHKITQVITVL